jgi:hypothetical protein
MSRTSPKGGRCWVERSPRLAVFTPHFNSEVVAPIAVARRRAGNRETRISSSSPPLFRRWLSSDAVPAAKSLISGDRRTKVTSIARRVFPPRPSRQGHQPCRPAKQLVPHRDRSLFAPDDRGQRHWQVPDPLRPMRATATVPARRRFGLSESGVAVTSIESPGNDSLPMISTGRGPKGGPAELPTANAPFPTARLTRGNRRGCIASP